MEKQNVHTELESFKLVPYQFYNVFSFGIPDFLEEFSEANKIEILPVSVVDSIIIFSNKRKNILLQMSQLKNEFSSFDINTWLEELVRKNSRLTPGFQLLGTRTTVINGVTLGCVDYKSNALDDDMYTITFVFSIKGYIFQGSWITPLALQNESLQTFLAMINALSTEV